MSNILFIGFAGFLGTVARYILSGYIARRYGESFPTGTLVVNLMGCFLIGAVYHLFQERFLVDPLTRSLVLFGFLGGFTTFSSFGLQTFALFREGQWLLAAVNVVVANLGGLLMVWMGYTLMKITDGAARL